VQDGEVVKVSAGNDGLEITSAAYSDDNQEGGQKRKVS
jgi:hypothetical protein